MDGLCDCIIKLPGMGDGEGPFLKIVFLSRGEHINSQEDFCQMSENKPGEKRQPKSQV